MVFDKLIPLVMKACEPKEMADKKGKTKDFSLDSDSEDEELLPDQGGNHHPLEGQDAEEEEEGRGDYRDGGEEGKESNGEDKKDGVWKVEEQKDIQTAILEVIGAQLSCERNFIFI